jgi:arginyl-tRNA synthetase
MRMNYLGDWGKQFGGLDFLLRNEENWCDSKLTTTRRHLGGRV